MFHIYNYTTFYRLAHAHPNLFLLARIEEAPNLLKIEDSSASTLVAGVGFEPTTFG